MARIRWAALCVAVFACAYSFPVAASEPQVATGVVCDTAEQALMYGSLYDEAGPEGALEKVNADANDPNACVNATIMYVAGEAGKQVSAAGRSWVVTAALVIAVQTSVGITRVEPKVFYVLRLAEGRPA